MIVSHRKKFVFIHIYKTAGTSVRSALREYADITHDRITLRRILYVARIAPPPSEHAKACEIRKMLGEDLFNSYYKFAFVRNPWDWQVSMYHYVRSHPLHPLYFQVRKLKDFGDYTLWLKDRENDTQSSFLTDINGEFIVEKIGRFEEINNDFEEICKHIDVNKYLPHQNQSARACYRQYYNEQSRARIEELFQIDIENFGYSF
ncbi:MAG: sulfotransferase [Spongiibacteraceae bacterium]|jgi:hypothetical protein|nr:sulfotransferase [Spongiibacteraceae bacterium]